MKTITFSIILLLSFSINSCKTKKEVTETENTKKTELVKNQKIEVDNDQNTSLIKKGYSKATVIIDDTKNEFCAYLYQLENGTILEPRLLPETMFENNAIVYIKYAPQRRMSRCVPAQPVGIIDVQVVK